LPSRPAAGAYGTDRCYEPSQILTAVSVAWPSMITNSWSCCRRR